MFMFSLVFVIHASVLFYWAERINRKYYHWATYRGGSWLGLPRPAFKPLPAALKFPNLEVSVMVVFSSGMVESGTAIVGAWAGGAYDISNETLGLAFTALSIVGVFYIWQTGALIRFWKLHAKYCWKPAEPAQDGSQINDPIFALMARCGISPRAIRQEREIGEWEPTDESEPARTERALHQFFCCKRYAPSGKVYPVSPEQQRSDEMEVLKQWLNSCSGVSVYALWYQLFQVLLTISISICTGMLFAHPVGPTYHGQLGLLITLACLQFVAMIWTATSHAYDFWEGATTTICYGFEFTAAIGMIISSVMNESDEPAKQADAASWAEAAANVLLYSAFVPIGLSLYDLLLCPIVIRVRGQEAQTWGELICAISWAIILLPLGVAAALSGADTTFLDVAAEAEESVTGAVLVEGIDKDAVDDEEEALGDSAGEAAGDDVGDDGGDAAASGDADSTAHADDAAADDRHVVEHPAGITPQQALAIGAIVVPIEPQVSPPRVSSSAKVHVIENDDPSIAPAATCKPPAVSVACHKLPESWAPPAAFIPPPDPPLITPAACDPTPPSRPARPVAALPHTSGLHRIARPAGVPPNLARSDSAAPKLRLKFALVRALGEEKATEVSRVLALEGLRSTTQLKALTDTEWSALRSSTGLSVAQMVRCKVSIRETGKDGVQRSDQPSRYIYTPQFTCLRQLEATETDQSWLATNSFSYSTSVGSSHSMSAYQRTVACPAPAPTASTTRRTTLGERLGATGRESNGQRTVLARSVSALKGERSLRT